MSGGYYKFVKTTDGIVRQGQWFFDTIIGQPCLSNDKGTIVPMVNIIAVGDVLHEVGG